ncbi:MAG TPA: sn-glycerol-3-phosphate ABC transporter ATP-binding protein UgpC [Kofleriaceae bacterium]|nr:sn-glycerol-3-phosphate ABC transporter ATP-binding protein UgpC [Kofleriaceae bacterium]
MAGVCFQEVSKRFGEQVIVHDLDLEIRDGEFLVLVGGSGCGKSTTLRMVAGLESVSSGAIRIGERDVTRLPPRARDVAMVFQDYALYPHLTAYENMALGLKLRKVARPEVERRVRAAAAMLALEGLLDRRPKAMSGGQRQRVAIGRAVVREPSVFLFDEPLSNLDAHLRNQMRVDIHALQRRLGTTAIYVTHDQVEAMTLADRLVILEGGRLQQIGSPIEVYRGPRNRFVASFIGTPPINLIEGELTRRGGGLEFVCAGGRLSVPDERCPAGGDVRAVTLGVRPQDLALADTPATSALAGQLVLVERLGGATHLHVEVAGRRLVAAVSTDVDAVTDQPCTLAVDMRHVHFFAADGDALTAPVGGSDRDRPDRTRAVAEAAAVPEATVPHPT